MKSKSLIAVAFANGALFTAAPATSLADTPWHTLPDTVGTSTVYTAPDGSLRAEHATKDGGVRQLVKIDGPQAPTSYEFPIEVPAGGKLTLTDDGGAKVTDAYGLTIKKVAAPWAKEETTGRPVKTYYTVEGNILVQHVAHRALGTAYPVVADPWCSFTGGCYWAGRWPVCWVKWEWRYRC